jgi:hypothetical protein
MRALGKQIGLGVALVFSVALVTLLFTFLGTIASAALVGMMAGATRQWRWQIVLVSLVFPGVITTFMYFTKTNLTPQQNFVLPLVCFGAFWLTYLLTCALGYFEKREASASESAGEPAARMEASRPATATCPGTEGGATAPPLVVRAETLCESGLAELQGTWSRETPGVNGQACKKVIEVARGKLAMSMVGQDGAARVVCQGDVRLERLGPFKILKVLGPQSGISVPSAERTDPETWIYRIAGQRLVLASHLEASADSHDSTIETYIKLRDAG